MSDPQPHLDPVQNAEDVRAEMIENLRTTVEADLRYQRHLEAEIAWLRTALRDTYADLQQMVPGVSKPYVEAKLRTHSDGSNASGGPET